VPLDEYFSTFEMIAVTYLQGHEVKQECLLTLTNKAFETSVITPPKTRCHIPEDLNLQGAFNLYFLIM
jgi:hypothetical protein